MFELWRHKGFLETLQKLPSSDPSLSFIFNKNFSFFYLQLICFHISRELLLLFLAPSQNVPQKPLINFRSSHKISITQMLSHIWSIFTFNKSQSRKTFQKCQQKNRNQNISLTCCYKLIENARRRKKDKPRFSGFMKRGKRAAV